MARIEKRAARAIQRRVTDCSYSQALGAVREVMQQDQEEIQRHKEAGLGTLEAIIKAVEEIFDWVYPDE